MVASCIKVEAADKANQTSTFLPTQTKFRVKSRSGFVNFAAVKGRSYRVILSGGGEHAPVFAIVEGVELIFLLDRAQTLP